MRGLSRRVTYLIVAVVVVVPGLSSREYGDTLPVFLARYAGDTLWAMMVYLLISAAIPNTRIVQRAVAVLGVDQEVVAIR